MKTMIKLKKAGAKKMTKICAQVLMKHNRFSCAIYFNLRELPKLVCKIDSLGLYH
jgi:hypothetical protein